MSEEINSFFLSCHGMVFGMFVCSFVCFNRCALYFCWLDFDIALISVWSSQIPFFSSNSPLSRRPFRCHPGERRLPPLAGPVRMLKKADHAFGSGSGCCVFGYCPIASGQSSAEPTSRSWFVGTLHPVFGYCLGLPCAHNRIHTSVICIHRLKFSLSYADKVHCFFSNVLPQNWQVLDFVQRWWCISALCFVL